MTALPSEPIAANEPPGTATPASTTGTPTTWVRRRARPKLGRVGAWAGLGAVMAASLFPLYWVLRTALTAPRSVFTDTSSLLPVDPTIINFARVLGIADPAAAAEAGGSGATIDFMGSLWNTIVFAGVITFGQVLSCSLAAYVFARLHFRGRDALFMVYISALMIPGIVTLIPNFVLIRQFGLLNTMTGMVAPFLLMTPFAVFFLRQFFLTIHPEIEEAARIDGADRFTVMWRIVLPMARPAIATLSIVVFITAWNEYLWPLVVGQSEDVRVLTVALGLFRSQTPQGAPDWSGLMAGTALSIVPTVLLFMIAGRKVLDSIGFSGIK